MVSLIFYLMLAFKVSLYCILHARASLLYAVSKAAKREPAAGRLLAKQCLLHLTCYTGLSVVRTARRTELSLLGQLSHKIPNSAL